MMDKKANVTPVEVTPIWESKVVHTMGVSVGDELYSIHPSKRHEHLDITSENWLDGTVPPHVFADAQVGYIGRCERFTPAEAVINADVAAGKLKSIYADLGGHVAIRYISEYKILMSDMSLVYVRASRLTYGEVYPRSFEKE